MSGFNDEKYFRRCFKAFFGKTPSDYKLSENFSPDKS
ncbi:AraC family transcriptional regulator [Bacteroidota bacterium]